MSSEATDVCRFPGKVVLLEFPTDRRGTVAVEIPASCAGSEETHSWQFNWASSRQSWSSRHNGLTYFCYTYNFSLSGRQTNDFKYVKSFCVIKITCNGTDGTVVLAEETSDLMGHNYDQFKFSKEVAFSAHLLVAVIVEVTFQSYAVESPTQTSLNWILERRGSPTDVVIKTKDQDFPCHRVVLASVSEYFSKMFEVNMLDKTENVVNWVDVFEADVVQDLLHYVYTGQTPINLPTTCSKLLELAHMCLMGGLKALCAHQLKNAINVENMADILRAAVKNESEELQKIAVNFIVENYDINKHPAPWDQLGPEFVNSLTITLLKSMVAKKIIL